MWGQGRVSIGLENNWSRPPTQSAFGRTGVLEQRQGVLASQGLCQENSRFSPSEEPVDRQTVYRCSSLFLCPFISYSVLCFNCFVHSLFLISLPYPLSPCLRSLYPDGRATVVSFKPRSPDVSYVFLKAVQHTSGWGCSAERVACTSWVDGGSMFWMLSEPQSGLDRLRFWFRVI
jgi:hypothetical protein